MSELEALKKSGTPNHNEMIDKLDKLIEVNQAVLKTKVDQKADRKTMHDEWKRQKGQSTKLSLIAIFLAGAALWLTLIQVDKDGALRANIVSGFNILVSLFN